MAYQARTRDPLFDDSTQAMIERRGKEMLGLALILAGVAIALMLASYVPEDPSWLSATDAPAENLLGRFGASLAGPLYLIVGWASWGFVAIFLAWGLRLMRHQGSDRVWARAMFAPLAIAAGAIYASTLVPAEDWTHSFGMGGLFGDTVLGAILSFLPVTPALGLKIMALVSAAATLVMALYVLAFSMQELRLTTIFMASGVVMLYGALASGVAMGVTGTATGLGRAGMGTGRALSRGVRSAAVRRREKAERREEAPKATRRAVPPPPEEAPARSRRPVKVEPRLQAPEEENLFEDEDDLPEAPAPAPRAGLVSRLFRRRPAPVEEEFDLLEEVPEGPADPEEDDRVRQRIASAIKARARATPPLTHDAHGAGGRAEPPLKRRHPRGPQPMLISQPRKGPLAEPPLSAPVPAAADHGADERHAAMPEMPEPELVPPQPLSQQPQPQISMPAQKKVVQHPPARAPQPSTRARAEAQPQLQFEESHADYELPPLNLLASPDSIVRHHLSDEALEENARMLETVLDDYGVKGEIVSVRPGPVVTMYELEPAPGLKASRVIGLADDIARSMSALSARVSTVPGRSVIGIELPNENREMVSFREILSTRDYGDGNHRLPLALGKDIGGGPVVANLAKMPHLLIAGTTGSGKSVAINTMILSLLYKLTPEECRLIMIDPKMLELSVYDGIPHLLSPVVTDPKKAVVALKWVVGEMEDRYRKMSKMGVRNIEGYNGRVADALAKGETFSRTVQTGFDDETGDPVFETEEIQPVKLPYIVVIVDEMADLMMVAGKEIEACIQRLAQMARASGIHLIMATQRPSVDVITGTIKANFPTRISFQVTSKIDSRTILGEQGAEQLLGQGDMLYMAGGARITRVHGPFVSDEEVEEIVNHLKAFGPPDYVSGVVQGPDEEKESDIDAVLGLGGNADGEDALYDQAVAIVIKDRKCSTSYIQRKLAIGYNKAARLVEQMEDEGVVSSANHVGKREILVPEPQ
jgi:S-DNA-T family DNA segregation ATPase FtsK/SpoIIIE